MVRPGGSLCIPAQTVASPDSYQPQGGSLTSGFSGAVHCDFDGSMVGGNLWGVCKDGDGQSEALASAAPTDKPEVVESRHLVLHGRGGVSQLRRVVFVIARHDGDQSAIRNVAQRYHLGTNQRDKGRRQCHRYVTVCGA